MNDISVKSTFGYIEERFAYALLIYGVLCSTLYIFAPPVVLQALIIIVPIVFAVMNPYLCLAGTIVSTLYASELFPSYVQVLISVMIIISFIAHNVRMLTHFHGLVFLLISIVVVVLSSVLGIDPNYNIGLLMVICVARMIVLHNDPPGSDIVFPIMGYISQGISMVLYFIISMIRGTNVTTFRRLSFEGDIKAVAVAVAFPLLIILLSKLEGKYVFSNFNNSFVEYLLIGSLAAVLFLTLARGIIIAIVITLILFIILSPRGRGAFVRFIPVLVFAAMFVLVLSSANVFYIQRLFLDEEYSTMNGRSDIWLYYLRQINNSGFLHVLFGVGPGSISRIGSKNYYAHSTFFDFYFSYGLVGFIAIIVYEVRLLLRVIRTHNVFAICIFVASVIVYLAHGSAANVTMFTVQILMLMFAESSYAVEVNEDD